MFLLSWLVALSLHTFLFIISLALSGMRDLLSFSFSFLLHLMVSIAVSPEVSGISDAILCFDSFPLYY